MARIATIIPFLLPHSTHRLVLLTRSPKHVLHPLSFSITSSPVLLLFLHLHGQQSQNQPPPTPPLLPCLSAIHSPRGGQRDLFKHFPCKECGFLPMSLESYASKTSTYIQAIWGSC